MHGRVYPAYDQAIGVGNRLWGSPTPRARATLRLVGLPSGRPSSKPTATPAQAARPQLILRGLLKWPKPELKSELLVPAIFDDGDYIYA